MATGRPVPVLLTYLRKYNMKTFSKISVVGLGYIGLPTAAMLASRKIRVIGVDVNETTVDTINRGEIHIIEPDLDIVVRAAVTQGYLKATTIPEPAEAFLLAVPTPFKSDNNNPDLSFIKAAVVAIAPVLQSGNLIILESTSPVGTTEQLSAWLAEVRPDLTFPQTHGEASDIRIAHCPERVMPGHIVRELVENDRVIGGMTKACSDAAIALYKIFVTGDCVVTNARTAEMAKLTENSFRDVNIAFANELSMICDELEIDVWELISLANRHPRVNILQPGPGVGGHCIAVDPWFIVAKTPDLAHLIRTAREVNDAKPGWVVKKVKEAIAAYLMENPDKTSKDITIVCYGLTFKADIDDLRESPALEIVQSIVNVHGGPVLIVEPNAKVLPAGLQKAVLSSAKDGLKKGQIHVMLVGHKEFIGMNFNDDIAEKQIIDTRGIWT